MPMYVYGGESPRLYPYPPIARELAPGDEVELDEDQVPTDGRFAPRESAAPAVSKTGAKTVKE